MNRCHPARTVLFAFAFSHFPFALGGCSIFGVAAQALPRTTIKPVYTGLQGQTVGVMVWVDRGLRMDYPPLQIDIANATQIKLIKSKAGQLKGTEFPVRPASIVKYQQDHPELEAESIADVAPRLGVSRLIYIEVEDFATRAQGAVELYRGAAEVTLRVVEVKNGVGKVAYEENGIAVIYPEKAPPEGIPNATDRKIYIGTVDALSTLIVRKFVPYAEER